ncbi:MAG: SRPBCC family protein [Dehalococcoidia bacterium]
MTYSFERTALIPAPPEEVFAFFAEPDNLALITPKSMRLRKVRFDEPPVRAGFRVEYTIRWLFLRLTWVEVLPEWQPPERFVDVQVRGPYKSFRHEHLFEEREGETMMRDVVQYELPFGILGSIAHRLIVARQLKRIFDYRARRIREIFARADVTV